MEYLNNVEKRNSWMTPLGILITLVITLSTTATRDFLFKAEVWQAHFPLSICLLKLHLNHLAILTLNPAHLRDRAIMGIFVVVTSFTLTNAAQRACKTYLYCLPLEDQRLKQAGFKGCEIGKILISEKETLPFRKVTLFFVNEKLGF